ncbi:hypothetical protein BA894_01205 [Vibrio natriegens]|uniref:efflux RND transporter periplasmic adaptor subunit n=1 Tax=Vibrio natriegens TaxID=691 RepID=UPI0008040606|nr:efflux RND transporter periplasmic adaptor subunit [Vibrio natriegens]ANQ25151.1 hypothetical protein BA894_01205 [Vibrio natriegens]
MIQTVINARRRLVLFVVLVSITACKGQSEVLSANPPPNVGFITAQNSDVEVYNDYTGRTEAWRTAQIRPRVSGIIEHRLFQEGSDVDVNQSLFQLDTLPYLLAVNDSKASLNEAKANLSLAESTWNRNQSLITSQAISRQSYEDSKAAFEQAKARVEAASAELDSSQLQLKYTDITAPIQGRIGKALVTEGNLVNSSDASVLATIQQIDPLYVSFFQSAEDYQPQKAISGSDNIQIILSDGSTYPTQGKLLFADSQVSQTTGEINIRAELANPNHVLLPGQYVKVRMIQHQYNHAFLLPQQAVTRNSTGDHVWIIRKDDTVEHRKVKIAQEFQSKWIVTGGLKNGEAVVVDGFQRIRPDIKVTPISMQSESPTNTVE